MISEPVEYTYAAAAAFAIAVLITILRGAARDAALWLGLLSFAILTVFADSALIGAGVFGYAARFRSGVDVLLIPGEDLLYGCALYLVAVAAWSWRRGR